MKKIITLSVLTMLALTSVSNANPVVSATSAGVGSYAGAIGALYLISTSNGGELPKETVMQLKADINEYQLTGQISPALREVINSAKIEKSELSEEEIISGLYDKLDEL